MTGGRPCLGLMEMENNLRNNQEMHKMSCFSFVVRLINRTTVNNIRAMKHTVVIGHTADQIYETISRFKLLQLNLSSVSYMYYLSRG